MPFEIIVVSPTQLPPTYRVPATIFDTNGGEFQLNAKQTAGFHLVSTVPSNAIIPDATGNPIEVPVIVYTMQK